MGSARREVTAKDKDAARSCSAALNGACRSRCICEICTCTKHVCPRHRPRKEPFDGKSVFKVDFPAHSAADAAGAVQDPVRPFHKVTGVRFEGVSSMNVDYQAPSAQALRAGSARAKPPEEQRAPARRLDAKSSYKADYLRQMMHTKTPQVVQKDSISGLLRPDGKCERGTSYHNDYTWKENASVERSSGPPHVPLPNRRFVEKSSYKTSYLKHEPRPRPQSARPPRAKLPEETRDFTTTCLGDYIRPPAPRCCEAAVLMQEVPPPTPGSGREHVYFDEGTRRWH